MSKQTKVKLDDVDLNQEIDVRVRGDHEYIARYRGLHRSKDGTWYVLLRHPHGVILSVPSQSIRWIRLA